MYRVIGVRQMQLICAENALQLGNDNTKVITKEISIWIVKMFVIAYRYDLIIS